MDPPLERIDVGGHMVHLIGTVAGFGPDGDRTRSLLEEVRPGAVALGIPADDLQDLHRLCLDPSLADDIPELDGADGHFIKVLERFGPVAIAPSPDLAAAHAYAAAAGTGLDAVDLSDIDHTTLYTNAVGARHLLQRTRVLKVLQKRDFAEQPDAYAFAAEWDAAVGRVKPLARIERAREKAMATGVRSVLRRVQADVVAVVPSARVAGIVTRLGPPPS